MFLEIRAFESVGASLNYSKETEKKEGEKIENNLSIRRD